MAKPSSRIKRAEFVDGMASGETAQVVAALAAIKCIWVAKALVGETRERCDQWIRAALTAAVGRNDVATVRLILAEQPLWTLPMTTEVLYAAMRSSPEMMDVLLDNYDAAEFYSFFTIACGSGSQAAALVERLTHRAGPDGLNRALAKAVDTGSETAVSAVLRAGAKPTDPAVFRLAKLRSQFIFEKLEPYMVESGFVAQPLDYDVQFEGRSHRIRVSSPEEALIVALARQIENMGSRIPLSIQSRDAQGAVKVLPLPQILVTSPAGTP